MRVLLAGWFSFDNMGATAGDMIARDIICQWLSEANIEYRVADCTAFPYKGGINWQKTNPSEFTDLLFVCGPFGNGWPVTEMLAHFSNCRLTGVNLSLMEPLTVWNPFTLLLERDSSKTTNPDITFLGPLPAVPVVGVILSHKQKEYGSRSLHDMANEKIDELLNTVESARVSIDTSLLDNTGGLRTAGEVEAMIAKMDLVITTRLHGTVLSIKNGVPVIPIDPIEGGAKISLQVKELGWPILFNAATLDNVSLSTAFQYCLSRTAHVKALECAEMAGKKIKTMKETLLSKLLQLSGKELAYGN
jgi:hypothetical protein